jgi:pyridoxamine 5'-phosphate oxidase
MDDGRMTDSPSPGPTGDHALLDTFRTLLRTQRVWDADLPAFDADGAPGAPLPLFHRWFAEAVAAGQPEPHVMSLATADAEGRPDVRVLVLHDADERGWHFATHSTSRKGRQLAARPQAAAGFYWHAQGRAVRVRGGVVAADAAATGDDLHARSAGALAAALVGRQSDALASRADLARAYADAFGRAARTPGAEAPTWAGYVLVPDEVEFFQGDAGRQHVRLRYTREHPAPGAGGGVPPGWAKSLLWP